MAGVRTLPPDVDDREIAAEWVVRAALPDGQMQKFGPMPEAEARALGEAMVRANPDWKVMVQTANG